MISIYLLLDFHHFAVRIILFAQVRFAIVFYLVCCSKGVQKISTFLKFLIKSLLQYRNELSLQPHDAEVVRQSCARTAAAMHLQIRSEACGMVIVLMKSFNMRQQEI